MNTKDIPGNLIGKTIVDAKVSQVNNFEPVSLTLVFDDGTQAAVTATLEYAGSDDWNPVLQVDGKQVKAL